MTSATVGKLGLLLSSSPFQVDEETKAMIENHLGIVSILRSDHANSNMATANTLRRNLSADMSSRKWLAQNGLSFSSSTSMKKIASSEQLSSLEDQINSRPGQDDVWMSIQLKNINNNNNNKKVVEKPDTWESILSQNAKEDHQYPNNITPPPYVHPLVKRSSSLSDKSLQICTESLGSETGSEDFSSYPSSETTSSDTEDQNKEEQQQQLKQASQMEKQSVVVVVDSDSGREEWQPTKCMYSTRSTSTRSFPPPLSSLAQSAGPTLHMQSRRLHGRLVLEAVSVPSKNFFQAQRQDGRLVLKLNSNQNQDLSETNVVDDDFEEEDEEEVEEIVRQETKVKEVTVLMEQEPRLLQSVGTKVKEVTVLMEQQEPRLLPSMGTIMFQKIMRIDNVNPAWPNRFNRKINLSRVEMELELDQEEDATAQSLPHVARLIRSPATTTTVGTTGSFNAYDYFWRTKPTNNQQSPTEKNNNNNKLTNPHNSPKACERQELVFLRGNKGEYLVPLMTGCKDSRRSLLIWEPYCVATS